MSDAPKVVPMAATAEDAVVNNEKLKRNVNVFIETQQSIAKIRRASYLAYIAEGFTKEEALELCHK